MKKDDIIAVVKYAKITETRYDSVGATDLSDGQKFYIHGKSLIDDLLSADDFSSEEKVTKTKMAEILSSTFNTPFTVEFEKADKSIRTLRGRLISAEPLMGRCQVIDLDIQKTNKESGLRLVDNRTLHSLTINGVKYTKK